MNIFSRLLTTLYVAKNCKGEAALQSARST